MIVRLMGEGQYQVDDGLRSALADLDDEALAALHRDDEPELDRFLDEMWSLVKAKGERLPDDDLSTSDVIVPPSDLTLEETRELMSESEGLIPDIPRLNVAGTELSSASRPVGAGARVVDLAYPFSPDFPLFPVYDPVGVAERFTVAEDGFFVQSWHFDEHSGTHVDAPAHFSAGAATVELIPPAELILQAIVVDIRERVEHDHDAVVRPDDVFGWESRFGRLPESCAVLALTGWGARAGDTAAYLNMDGAGVMHVPGFGPEATEFLKSERPGVRAIGLDTASLDIGASTEFAAHASWLPSGRYGIENLANLEQLPPLGATIVVGVPAWAGGSGGPARVLALIP